MQLKNLNKAVDLYEKLNIANNRIDDATHRLGVTLGGKYDDLLADKVRAQVVAELRKERGVILDKLSEIGVYDGGDRTTPRLIDGMTYSGYKIYIEGNAPDAIVLAFKKHLGL